MILSFFSMWISNNFVIYTAGWSLADNTPYARLAIQSRLWGTSYVVLKDGKVCVS